MTESHSSNLIRLLAERQEELGLSDGQFAERLGISKALWHLHRSGKREPALSLLQAVVQRFPELQAEVLMVLRNGSTEGEAVA